MTAATIELNFLIEMSTLAKQKWAIPECVRHEHEVEIDKPMSLQWFSACWNCHLKPLMYLS